jgi:hypothetical protein
MKEAHYSVVRYIADPARNEPYNVGIILWDEKHHAFGVDEGALARVVRDNPHLERDALLYLYGYVRQRVARSVPPFTKEGELRVIAEQTGFPVFFTEPRHTTLSADDKPGFQETLDRLLDRIVRPPRRRGGGSGVREAAELQRELKPLIEEQRIQRNFPLEAPGTKVARSVDFYANHGSHVALDVVNFALSKASDIRDRADREAFKIWDLLKSDQISHFYVLPVLGAHETMKSVNDIALSIVESTGGELVADVDEARELLVSAAGLRLSLMDL